MPHVLASDPPPKCLRADANGDLPTCTSHGSTWSVDYPDLLDGGGLDATYLAASLRAPSAPDVAPGRSARERLQELQELRDQGLITVEEYDERRASILGSI